MESLSFPAPSPSPVGTPGGGAAAPAAQPRIVPALPWLLATHSSRAPVRSRAAAAAATAAAAAPTFESNSVHTSRYTLLTFVPLLLFEQFRRLANAYFLAISVVQLATTLSPTSPYSTVLPLCVVLAVAAAREATEDWQRHAADAAANSADVRVLRRANRGGGGDGSDALDSAADEGEAAANAAGAAAGRLRGSPRRAPAAEWHVVPRSEVRVGDIVLIEQDEAVPADVVLIASSAATGTAFVDSASLDGETSLKLRAAPASAQPMGADPTRLVLGLGGAFVECEPPNARLFDFSGVLHWPRSVSARPASAATTAAVAAAAAAVADADITLSRDSVLLCSMVLRNTSWACGLVVYAGNSTKVMLNASSAVRKRSRLDVLVDRLVLLILLLLVVLCTVCAVASRLWATYNPKALQYLPFLTASADLIGEVWVTTLLLLNGLLPISLYVTLEVAQYVQARAIEADPSLKHVVYSDANADSGEGESGTAPIPFIVPARARCSALSPSLGMIGTIVTDKTGTLTENSMKLRALCIGREHFGSVAVSGDGGGADGGEIDASGAAAAVNPGFSDARLFEALRDPSCSFHADAVQAVLTMALCHTVQVGRRQRRRAEGSGDAVGGAGSGQSSGAGASAQGGGTGAVQSGNVGVSPLPSARSTTSSTAPLRNGKSSKLLLISTLARQSSVSPRTQLPHALQAVTSDPSMAEEASESGEAADERESKDEADAEYQSASPDEVALVLAARSLGYALVARDDTSMTLRVRGVRLRYEVLAVNEFDNVRKRMSVLLRGPDGACFLLVKGADSAVVPRVTNAAPQHASALQHSTASKGPCASPPPLRPGESSLTIGVAGASMTSPRGVAVPRAMRRASLVRTYNVIAGSIAAAGGHLPAAAAAAAAAAAEAESPREGGPTPTSSSPMASPVALPLPSPLAQVPALSLDDAPVVAAATAGGAIGVSGSNGSVDLGSPVPGYFNTPRPRALSEFGSSSRGPAGLAAAAAATRPALRQDEFSSLTALQQALDAFATAGLRTLVLARRNCDALTAAQLVALHHEALLLTVGREAGLQTAAEEMERELSLTGATGVEDRLQAGVPETVALLSGAGIRFVMCTGDKTETAISVGLACSILAPDCDLVVLKSRDRATNVASIAAARNSLAERGLWRPGAVNPALALVIEGHALHELLADEPVPLPPVPKPVVPPLPPNATWMQRQQSIRQQSAHAHAHAHAHGHGHGCGHSGVLPTLRFWGASALALASTVLDRVAGLISGESDEEQSGPSNVSSRGIGFFLLSARVSLYSARSARGSATAATARSMTSAESRAELLEFIQQCRAVVCARVSPLQKAAVVRLLQKGLQPRQLVLAVGDGGNDVSMIQTADVGVGIAGVEGRLAALSSDFAIGQFRHLAPLLLVHGRSNYLRLVLAVCYSIYKSVVLGLVLWGYTFWTGFSGTSLFDSFISSMWSLLFTSLPILSAACFDEDLPPAVVLTHPAVYFPGPRNARFSTSTVALWLAAAALHALVIGVAGANNLLGAQGSSGSGGLDGGLTLDGTAVHGALLLTVSAKLALEVFSLTSLTALAFAASAAFWLIFIGLYSSLLPLLPSTDATADYYGVAAHLLNRASFWLVLLVVPVAALLTDVCLHCAARELAPDYTMLVQEASLVAAAADSPAASCLAATAGLRPSPVYPLASPDVVAVAAARDKVFSLPPSSEANRAASRAASFRENSTRMRQLMAPDPEADAHSRRGRVASMSLGSPVAGVAPGPDRPSGFATDSKNDSDRSLAAAAATLLALDRRQVAVVYASADATPRNVTSTVGFVRAGVTGLVIDSDVQMALDARQRASRVAAEISGQAMSEEDHEFLLLTLMRLARQVRAELKRKERRLMMRASAALAAAATPSSAANTAAATAAPGPLVSETESSSPPQPLRRYSSLFRGLVSSFSGRGPAFGSSAGSGRDLDLERRDDVVSRDGDGEVDGFDSRQVEDLGPHRNITTVRGAGYEPSVSVGVGTGAGAPKLPGPESPLGPAPLSPASAVDSMGRHGSVADLARALEAINSADDDEDGEGGEDGEASPTHRRHNTNTDAGDDDFGELEGARGVGLGQRHTHLHEFGGSANDIGMFQTQPQPQRPGQQQQAPPPLFSRFTRRFLDPAREKVFFRTFFVRKSTRITRTAVAVAVIFATAYLLINLQGSTTVQNAVRSLLVGGGLGFLVLTCLNVFRDPSFYSGAMLTAVIVAGVMKTLIITNDGAFGQTLYQMAILLVLRMRFLHAIAAALIDLSIYIVFTALSETPAEVDATLPSFVVFVLFCMAFGASSARSLHAAMREDFLSESRLFMEERRGHDMVAAMLPAHVVSAVRHAHTRGADGGSAGGGGTGSLQLSETEPSVSIVFVDIQGFKELTAAVTPPMLVALLDRLWALFDALVEKHAITKLETVGKEYVACAGLHGDRRDHATACVAFGCDVLRLLVLLRAADGRQAVQVRIGVNSGPVVAGIVGRVRPQFVLVGDTTNVSSRMSSSGLDGCVNLSPATYARVRHRFHCVSRTIEVKSKGRMTVYYVAGKARSRHRSTVDAAGTVVTSGAAALLEVSSRTIEAPSTGHVTAATTEADVTAADEAEVEVEASDALVRRAMERRRVERSRIADRVARRARDVTVHPVTYRFRAPALEARWRESQLKASIPGIQRAVVVLAIFSFFRLTDVAVRYDLTQVSTSSITRPTTLETSARLSLSFGLLLFFLLTRTAWYRDAGLDEAARAAAALEAQRDGIEADGRRGSLAPAFALSWHPVQRAFDRGAALAAQLRVHVRLRLHRLLIVLSGALMIVASVSSHDASLDLLFFYTVSSNSQALSFPEATAVNIAVTALFVLLAYVTDRFEPALTGEAGTELDRTEFFFLVAGIAMCALAQSAVEFYRRHRFAVAFLFASEVKRNLELLHRMLPAAVVAQLMLGSGEHSAHQFDNVCILFCDVAGFTKLSAASSPVEIIAMLNVMFAGFERAAARNECFKVQTIGDCFVCIAGIPYVENDLSHAVDGSGGGGGNGMPSPSRVPSFVVSAVFTPTSPSLAGVGRSLVLSPNELAPEPLPPGPLALSGPPTPPAPPPPISLMRLSPYGRSGARIFPSPEPAAHATAPLRSAMRSEALPPSRVALAAAAAEAAALVEEAPADGVMVVASASSSSEYDPLSLTLAAAAAAASAAAGPRALRLPPPWACLSARAQALLPTAQLNAARMLRTALEFIHTVRHTRHPRTGERINVRIGLHTGAVIGGVIGTRSFRFDCWGPDVLVANQHETGGVAGGINVSKTTHAVLADLQRRREFAIPGLRMTAHPGGGGGNELSYLVHIEGFGLAEE